ncbi:MAG: hypothetical protein Q4D68_04705, partial [Moraxella equi]|nr:hypothetical protein [Moraxella equi]
MQLLKLSATALIIGGASLVSQSAISHTNAGDLHNQQSLCSYGYNPNCGNNGGSYGGGGVIDDYLGLAWTKDGKPFFYNAQYR